jgi:hypothetical protein
MKNTIRFFALGLLGFVFSLTCNAKEIAGIPVPESLTLDTLAFKLQGAGMRDKFFMDLYIASLYATQAYSDASALVDADEPMVLSLHILSSLITSEKMEEATKEGFINATGGNTTPLQEQIDTFIQTFKEPIAINDRYEFFYLPSKGVRISKNGIHKTTLEGLAFKKALFGIWLGEKPAQESLKKELMGK